MAFDSGYFTSTTVTVNEDGIPVGDKAKNAAFFALEKFHLKGNGISLKPTSAFYVAPKSGLIATVSAGWGIMEGYPFHLTEDLDITMTSSVSDQTLYIGVRLDVASNEYTDDDVVARTTFVAATDRVFAIIVIPANAVTLTTAMITDTRYNSTYCGVTDEYDVALAAMVTEFTGELARITSEGLPTHASTHAAGEDDEITPAAIGAESSTLIVNAQTDNYTILSTDDRAMVTMDSASNKTFTFATQAVGGYADGTIVILKRLGTGTVTIAGAGVTFQSAGTRMKIAERYGVVYARKISTDLWEIVGNTGA